MRYRAKDYIPSLIITMLILIVLEILSTAVIPIFGVSEYRLPFNILIVLYLALKLEIPLIAIFILCLQYIHSFFSVEGWAAGTCAGILVSMIISTLRDVIHLSTASITIFTVQVFQLLWFSIVSTLLYISVGNFDEIIIRLWKFLPESIVLSFLSPFFFAILDKIWIKGGGNFGDSI